MSDYLFETEKNSKGYNEIHVAKTFLNKIYHKPKFYIVEDCQENTLRFFARHESNLITKYDIKIKTKQYNKRVNNNDSWLNDFLNPNLSI